MFGSSVSLLCALTPGSSHVAGAVMTLLNVLSSVEKIDVAIVLSGYLALPGGSKTNLCPLKSELTPLYLGGTGKVELLAPEAPRDTPIFWGHGMDDPILT